MDIQLFLILKKIIKPIRIMIIVATNPRKYMLIASRQNIKWLLKLSFTEAIKNDCLKAAADFGALNVVQYLIKRGADINVSFSMPVRIAARNGHLEVVKFLTERGADINAADGYAMRHAVLKNRIEVVRYLIFAGVNLDLMMGKWSLTTVGSHSREVALEHSYKEILDILPVYPKRVIYSD